MALSKQEIAAAQAMHRFVKNHERRFSGRRMTIYLLMTSLLLQVTNDRSPLHQIFLGRIFSADTMLSIQAAAFPAIVLAVIWFAFATVRYNRERAILGILEREHRDELPWHRPPPLPGRVRPPRLVLQA